MDINTKPVDMGAPTLGEIKKGDYFGAFWAQMTVKYFGLEITPALKSAVDADIKAFFEANVIVGRIDFELAASICKYICEHTTLAPKGVK